MSSYQSVQLYSLFTEKMGQSVGGLTEQFIITGFVMGHDPSLIDEQAKSVSPTPDNMDAPVGEFFGADLTAANKAWADGKLLVKCKCPPGALSEPQQYSILWLKDQDGQLVAAKVDLPDWVSPEEGVETWVYINFPTS